MLHSKVIDSDVVEKWYPKKKAAITGTVLRASRPVTGQAIVGLPRVPVEAVRDATRPNKPTKQKQTTNREHQHKIHLTEKGKRKVSEEGERARTPQQQGPVAGT